LLVAQESPRPASISWSGSASVSSRFHSWGALSGGQFNHAAFADLHKPDLLSIAAAKFAQFLDQSLGLFWKLITNPAALTLSAFKVGP
jgi:hypothetical protein